jgi:lipopolysaccharide export system permease protein
VTWIAVSGVLLVILLSLQLSRVLSQAAANDFPREVVFALIGLTSAGYLTMVVPVGLFLAVMLGLGRLYHESEMAAIQACGIGPAGLYRPIAGLGLAIFVLLTWLSLWALPNSTARAQEIRAAALRDAQFGLLEPGRFRTFGGGNVVFYAERIDDKGILHNVSVFVERTPSERAAASAAPTGPVSPPVSSAAAAVASEVDHSPGGENGRAAEDGKQAPELEIWVAARAEQRGAGRAEQTFILYDGEHYMGVPGSGEFQITHFSEGGIPIRLGDVVGAQGSPEMKPTRALWGSAKLADRAELEWRFSTPVMAMILMLIAVPLARLRPRQGRFGRIGLAILVFFVYWQVLLAARTWLESGVVPQVIGLWWVHAMALCLGLWLLVRESWPGRARLVRAAA